MEQNKSIKTYIKYNIRQNEVRYSLNKEINKKK